MSDNGRSASCYLVPGSTDTGFCNYVLKSNGENCPADDYRLSESGDPLNPPDIPDVPPSDPNDPGCPSGWAWSGTTCVKTDGGDNGGDGGDGDGDGSGSGGGGDGSGSGGGDGGSGSGGGGGGSGSGGGGGGSGSGGGDGGSGSGGGGGGSGSGDGDGDGEDEEGSATSSGNCDTPPSAQGDPLQAAVLMQVWHSMCHGEALTKDHIESGFAAEGFTSADELNDYLIDNAEDIDNTISSVVSGVFTSGPSNACPLDDATIDTRWGSFTLPWTMSCPIFNVISQVMFWFSYLAAGWILYNSLARSD